MNLQKKRQTFFELGIAFARFSAKPDEDEYDIICKVTSQLELELETPDFEDLVVELITSDGVVGPPKEWFEESNRESLRNYSRIGTLSFAVFLLAQGNKDISDAAVTELKALFRVEVIPTDSLNDYLADLKTDNAAGAFRGFLAAFSRDLSSDKPDNQQIFDNLGSAPLTFDDDVLETLQLTIEETSRCYNHKCYLATIALCGKIIETLLANAFQVLIGKSPPERMGFGELRAALRGKGMPLDDSVDELLDLIYTHRSVAIHRGNLRKISFPTEGQAKHVAGLTQEVINIIYGYFNDPADSSDSRTECT